MLLARGFARGGLRVVGELPLTYLFLYYFLNKLSIQESG